MKNFATHLAVGAACLTAGGLAATAMTAPTKSAAPVAAHVSVQSPEQVRTQTVTHVIHRVHRVHLHPKAKPVRMAPAPPAPAPRAAAAPAPVAVVPRRVQTAAPIRVPIAHSAPARTYTKPTLHTRTSGSSTGAKGVGGEDGGGEGGGDD